MLETKVENSPPEGTPITGEPHIVDGIDITPRVSYNSEGIATGIQTFTVVNRDFLATREVEMGGGKYKISRFDEYHGNSSEEVVPRSRLEQIDIASPGNIPSLSVLGATMPEVKAVLTQNNKSAYHLLHI